MAYWVNAHRTTPETGEGGGGGVVARREVSKFVWLYFFAKTEAVEHARRAHSITDRGSLGRPSDRFPGIETGRTNPRRGQLGRHRLIVGQGSQPKGSGWGSRCRWAIGVRLRTRPELLVLPVEPGA